MKRRSDESPFTGPGDPPAAGTAQTGTGTVATDETGLKEDSSSTVWVCHWGESQLTGTGIAAGWWGGQIVGWSLTHLGHRFASISVAR